MEEEFADEELYCPICWVSSSQDKNAIFVKTPCGHVACYTCLERLLLSTESIHDFFRRYLSLEGQASYEQTMQHIAASCPTRGQCPICRQWIDLFDLTQVDTNTTPTLLAKITQLQLFPIYAMVFIPSLKSLVGPSFSFHFTSSGDVSCPFVRLDHSSDGSENTVQQDLTYDQPFDNFFFFPKSNSFHGRIHWRDGIVHSDHSTTWEVIIQFPSDFRCFSGGAIIKHKMEPSPTTECNERICYTPMVEFLGPRGSSFHRLKRRIAAEQSPTWNPLDVWGNTFMQSEKIGFASYHFDRSSGQVYISYEHDDCCYWPPLDDGSPVPSRVPFINTSYDATLRVFRGEIAWKHMYHTSWNGSEAWNYEMTFDTEFTCIVSGTVHSVSHGQSVELSEYGQSLVYVNAALKQYVEQKLARMDEQTIHNHRTIVTDLVQRLTQEHASVRTIASVTSIVNRTSINLLNG